MKNKNKPSRPTLPMLEAGPLKLKTPEGVTFTAFHKLVVGIRGLKIVPITKTRSVNTYSVYRIVSEDTLVEWLSKLELA